MDYQRLKNLIKKAPLSIRNSFNIDLLIERNGEFIIKETEKIVRVAQLRENLLTSKEQGITDTQYCEHDIIVSLTSYGKRIYDVCLTIESLMEQTLKPNKIILWLAETEFNHSELLQSLLKLETRGLSIEFCRDIRSYTKLIPSLEKYPDDIIITVDDDALYPYDLIENLVNSYKKNPELIHFCKGHRIKLKDTQGNEENIIARYVDWNHCISDFTVDKLNFPTGVGGILYPPHCFHSDVTNENLFMDLCPSGDDIWFKAMALLKGTLSKKVYTHKKNGMDYIDLGSESQQETALVHINWGQGKNDEQIKAVFTKYNLFNLLQ
jgi:hypothetical protein